MKEFDRSEIDHSYTRKSDKEVIMTSNSTVEVAGQKQETEMTITQKWTSETCTAQ